MIGGESAFERLEVPYQVGIGWIPVKGKQLHVLSSFSSPDNKRLFLVINFPKLGVLVSDDGGVTFSNTLFTSDYFIYQDYEDEQSNRSRRSIRRDISVHSVFDGELIVISVGPFLLVSRDAGQTWKRTSPFYDLDRSFIRKILVSDTRIYLFTDSKILYSDDHAKRWKTLKVKLAGENYNKFSFVDATVHNEKLYLSVKSNIDYTALLFQSSFDYFKNGKSTKSRSGVFAINDDSSSSKLFDLPLLFLDINDNLYGVSPFNFSFANSNWIEEFEKTLLYKIGSLKSSDKSMAYYLNNLKEQSVSFGIDENSRVVDILSKRLLSEDESQLLSKCITRTKIGFDPFIKLNGFDKDTGYNFFYNYQPQQLLREFTKGYWNTPVLQCTVSDITYRVSPDENYFLSLVHQALSARRTKDNTSPFLFREKSNFDLQMSVLDKFFPFKLERITTKDGKESVEVLSDSKEFRKLVGFSEERNNFYWYRMIDKKRKFRLEFTLGADESRNMLYYPSGLYVVGDKLMLEMSYYEKDRLFRQLFTIKTES